MLFINSFIDFAFLGDSANAAGIAVIHSLFNIGATIVLFPFITLSTRFKSVFSSAVFNFSYIFTFTYTLIILFIL